ncbi:MAG: regulatory protein RecX [Chloroflexi bacterium]|nr:regulatory protein RecX [Chloroflexota bacterium]
MKVNNSKTVQKARAYALRLLALQPRSATEVKQRLVRRFDSELADEIVARLTQQGLLDDAGFAVWWRDYRQRTKPRSTTMLRRELSAKGVGDADIASALNVQNPDDEKEIAVQIAKTFARRLANKDFDIFRRKVWSHLRRRGFSSSIAANATQQAWDSKTDDRDLERTEYP